jgi:DnaJ-class molecular chaperone
MKAPPRCLYSVLDLEPDATENDIKKAFRKAALVWHPDKHGDKSGAELEAVSGLLIDVLLRRSEKR